MVELKSFLRPTQIVRSVMRAHNKPTYWIYTNKYDKCRTVKCYHVGNPIELVGDIRTALIRSGVNSFSIKSIDSPQWMSRGSKLQSIIVRIPNTEQA